MIRIRSGVLVMMIVIALFPVFPSTVLANDTFEPNDTIATAYRIYAGPKVSYISTPTDVDFYSVYLWSGLQFTATLDVPSNRDYDLQLYNSSGTLLGGSYRGTGLTETINYTPSSNMWVYIKVYGYNGAHDTSQTYTVKATWASPEDVAERYSNNYRTLSGTWRARPWATTEGNPTRLAAPQSGDTAVVTISSGVPYGYGNKDMPGHVSTKYSTNSGYTTSSFYDYWWPTSRRTVMYSPNVYYSSGSTDSQGNADAIRHSGESIYGRRGWMGADCSGLYQWCLWLAGFKVWTSSTYEFGRIGTLDNKGNANMNTWGGEVGASTFSTTSLASDVTDWIPCDRTTAITFLSGMGPMRKGDMVVYRNASGTVVHVGVVAVPGTTQTNTLVDHAVWSCRYTDSVTSSTFFRRSARTEITVLSSGSFKIRRLTQMR